MNMLLIKNVLLRLITHKLVNESVINKENREILTNDPAPVEFCKVKTAKAGSSWAIVVALVANYLSDSDKITPALNALIQSLSGLL